LSPPTSANSETDFEAENVRSVPGRCSPRFASITLPSGRCSTGTVALGDNARKLAGFSRRVTSTASNARLACKSAMRARMA
jgi:hypothetical protein